MRDSAGKFEAQKSFLKMLDQDQNLSVGIAAIKTLLLMLENNKFDTIQELHSEIQSTVTSLKATDKPITAIVSGSELFSRFITLGKFDDKTMDECQAIMVQRGKVFLARLLECRKAIAQQGSQFITDGCRVLTHSRSRVVLETLIMAAQANKRFHVYVTKSVPDNGGEQTFQELTKAGINCTLILDSAIGYIMESVDMVLVGAEGVVESGGIINRIGTYTMALCAREMKKPFYVLTESFKFTRLYPLNQRDIPNDYKFCKSDDIARAHPLVDYTPPAYITLIFTDLGILTPSAVSDELIKLYL
ncbi:translation initiation factor eIF2B subunit alpha [Culicoides brevitarsis]|uniref:translation initiation factor eIF2B subunit alpha n=1 Tax=Culicoides brevitarsis TaxID=469753 RepID=UPI00307B19BF